MARCSLVAANLILFAAVLVCGIAFFAPYWLINVRPDEAPNGNGTYLIVGKFLTQQPDETYTRGLWAQCGRLCQWFWQYDDALQTQLFSPLKWHLAAQVLYFIACTLVLAALVISQLHFCCRRERPGVVRSLGSILLISFCVQTGAIAAFGGGAWNSYKASSSPTSGMDWSTTTDVYYDWCFWMSVAGGGLTLLSGVLYLVYDCCFERISK